VGGVHAAAPLQTRKNEPLPIRMRQMKNRDFSFLRVIFQCFATALIFFLSYEAAFAWHGSHLPFQSVVLRLIPFIPLVYLFAVYFLTKPKSDGKPVLMYQTNMQQMVERGLEMRDNKELRRAINEGSLPVDERSQKLKFPVLGFKGGTVSIFHIREDTSRRLPIADSTHWIFYDADARLVQPGITPPLTGWRRRVRLSFWGRWLIDVPENGWVWFQLKHPVEFHRDEVIERLTNCLLQAGVSPAMRDLGGLISLLDEIR
jgi:hypothetical protein